MKKLLMGAAVVALLASPAFAQSWNPNFPSGNLVPAPGALLYGSNNAFGSPDSPFAYAQTKSHLRRDSAMRAQAYAPDETIGRSDKVYEDGAYAGQDPDPNVRLQLRKDWAEINE